jgi:hypothetical protein
MNVQNYKNYVRFVGITVICLVIIPIITGCGVKPYKHVAPSFERFEVTHGSICVNEDLPLTVGVTWEADPGNVNEEYYSDHCVYIFANERSAGGIDCLDSGFSGGQSFDLRSVFGTDIPIPVSIEAKLCSGIQCAVVNDTASDSVPTQICTDPVIEPSG